MNVEGRGPKSLKVNEFLIMLNSYKMKLDWDWSINKVDTPAFIAHTIKLLVGSEENLERVFGIPNQECLLCKKVKILTPRVLYDIDCLSQKSRMQNIKDLLEVFLSVKVCHSCGGTLVFNDIRRKCFILQLKDPICLDASMNQFWFRGNITVISILTQQNFEKEERYLSHFCLKDKYYHQESSNIITESNVKRANVKMISFLINYNEE